MAIPELNIDLDRPAKDRWGGLRDFRVSARELIDYYVQDLGGLEQFGDLLISYRDAFVAKEYADDMRAIAEVLEVSEPEVLLTNLYYDALKHILGCTAFAVETDNGPLHARNLDWGTINQLLSRHTLIVNYQRAGVTRYRVVGWPGYAGCLSGLAPGRFAVTLNAVLSDDPPELAPPVTFLIREVLENALSYDDAVERLTHSPITSDCLLLVSGTRTGEMMVIERGPSRYAQRRAEGGCVVVTNDYRSMSGGFGPSVSELAQTSCGRFDRATRLIVERSPASAAECFGVLGDDKVRMNITVQSMVFSAKYGDLTVRLPEEV